MKRKNEPKLRRGRPERLTEAALAQIEEMALAGLSPLQMGSILKCSRKAIETFLDSHKDLKAKIPCYRGNSAALAKLILHQQLEAGDPETARWILEREAKQKLERERASLMRAQRKALEPSKEELPSALEPGAYWKRVNDYFTNRDRQTEAESSDKDGDQTSTADPGDNAGDKASEKTIN